MRLKMSPCIGKRASSVLSPMSERAMHGDSTEQPNWTAALGRGLWLLVRLPVFTLLVILEPVVALVLGGLALAGVLTTIFFVLIHAPHFPAWTMLALSIGFGLALMFYESLLRVFSR